MGPCLDHGFFLVDGECEIVEADGRTIPDHHRLPHHHQIQVRSPCKLHTRTHTHLCACICMYLCIVLWFCAQSYRACVLLLSLSLLLSLWFSLVFCCVVAVPCHTICRCRDGSEWTVRLVAINGASVYVCVRECVCGGICFSEDSHACICKS